MNLLRLHGNYLLNKINIIIIGIVIFIGSMLALILIKPFETETSRWITRLISVQNYEQSFIIFVKILMVLLSSYLFGIYFSKSGDDYCTLLTGSINKNKYTISKIITISLTIFFVLFSIVFFHILIGTVFNKWYVASIDIIKHYLEIYMISLSYGFLSIIFIRLFKSIYAAMLPFCLYLVSEVLVDFGTNNIIVRIVGLFFPTTFLNDGNIVLLYGMIHLLIINLLYMLVSYFIYINCKE